MFACLDVNLLKVTDVSTDLPLGWNVDLAGRDRDRLGEYIICKMDESSSIYFRFLIMLCCMSIVSSVKLKKLEKLGHDPLSWGGSTPILEGGWELPQDLPLFLHIPIPLGPFLCPTRFYWPLLSVEIISLSLSHLVLEIIWPKGGLIFHQIPVIWPFWSIWYQSSPCFSILLTSFFIVLKSLTSHFYKTLDPIRSIFSLCAGHP